MKTTEIEIGVIKFVITEIPKKEQLVEYETLLKNHQVDLLIRIVENSLLYEIHIPGLIVIDFTNFQDGSVPTLQIMERYIKTIEEIKLKYSNPVIAMHCFSSLGRCPTFLSISMIIENPKMDIYDIIIYIRKKRPGALNRKQMDWLIKTCVVIRRGHCVQWKDLLMKWLRKN